MAGTDEANLLGWLEREEEEYGFDTMEDALTDFGKARALFLNEQGIDLSEGQYQGLKDAQFFRYDELPSISVAYEKFYNPSFAGWQESYRDTITGRFVAKADVYSLLGVTRGS